MRGGENMREKREHIDDEWLDRLDDIAAGMDEPSPHDDELLHVAWQLTSALAPLRELDAPARAHRHRLGMQLRTQLAGLSLTSLTYPHTWKKWLFRPLVAAAAVLLFVLLGPGLIFEFNLAGENAGARHDSSAQSSSVHHNQRSTAGEAGWRAPNLLSEFSFTIMPPKEIPRGLTLLLPLNLPSNAYLVSINNGRYGSNTPIATYLIYTMNAHLYEAPVQPLPTNVYQNSAYTSIQIGTMHGILLLTGGGENRIEWYEQGLLCDLVSRAPVSAMVSMIEDLRPVTYP
jgi:hypothetical protein